MEVQKHWRTLYRTLREQYLVESKEEGEGKSRLGTRCLRARSKAALRARAEGKPLQRPGPGEAENSVGLSTWEWSRGTQDQAEEARYDFCDSLVGTGWQPQPSWNRPIFYNGLYVAFPCYISRQQSVLLIPTTTENKSKILNILFNFLPYHLTLHLCRYHLLSIYVVLYIMGFKIPPFHFEIAVVIFPPAPAHLLANFPLF